nr:ankyrin repeat domain-containing protein [Endozoicomonas sp.]
TGILRKPPKIPDDCLTGPFEVSPESINELQEAVKKGEGQKIYSLIENNPRLIKQYPDCLLVPFDDKSNKSMVYAMCESEHENLLIQALATEAGKKAAVKPASDHTTAVHIVAQTGTDNSLAILYRLLNNVQKEILLVKDNQGKTPLHYAILSHDYDTCEFIAKMQPASLCIKANDLKTPLAIVMRQNKIWTTDKKLYFINQMLELSHIQEKLCCIDFFADFRTGNPECDKRIQHLRNQQNFNFQQVPFDRTAAQAEKNKKIAPAKGGHSVDNTHRTIAPNASAGYSTDSINCEMEKQARAVLKGLGQVGVYGHFTCFPSETTTEFWSMGDESANIGIVRSLAELGAPNIQMRLSPPNALYNHNPQAAKISRNQFTPAQMEKYNKQHQVVLHKLAALLPEFDPKSGLPQTIQMSGSQVTILDCDDEKTEPPLTISMISGGSKYQQCGTIEKNYMVIQPYRFKRYIQELYTDFDGTHHRKVALDLPADSVIPRKKPLQQEDLEKPGFSETEWIKTRLTSTENQSTLASNLAHICAMSRQGKMHSGVIYGLHHQKITPQQRIDIVFRWIDILTRRASTLPVSKPHLVCMNSWQLLSINTLKLICKRLNIALIDLKDKSAEQHLAELTSDGEVAVCLIPTLPQPVFQHLIASSDLPTLTEGANTTSFLLQTGHSYLSLLPGGDTPIPVDMGDPLGVLEVCTLSSRLKMNADEKKHLTKLHQIILNEKDDEKAIELWFWFYSQGYFANSGFSNNGTIWSSSKSNLGIDVFLSEGSNALTPVRKQALISAMDPSDDAFVKYIDRTLDKNSITATHVTKQKKQINTPENNVLVAALVKFAKIKKLEV